MFRDEIRSAAQGAQGGRVSTPGPAPVTGSGTPGAYRHAAGSRLARPGRSVFSAVADHPGGSRGPRAQPPERLDRPPPRPAHRVHRAVGFGQVVARLRHHLRRGPAPLRRVAVVLRPAVPRADGQAGRGLHRGTVARPSPSTRSPRRATPVRRSGPSRRSTTTCACSTPGSASPTARAAAGWSPARPPSRSSTDPGDLPEGTRFQVLAPVVRGRKGEYCGPPRRPGQAGLRPGPGGRRAHRALRARPRSTSPATSSTPSRWWSTGWSGATTSAGGLPSRSRRRCASPRGSPRSWWSDADGTERGGHSPSPSTWPACTAGSRFDELAPRNFSFNSPYGACPACNGLGTRFEVDPDLVVPDPISPFREGRIGPWAGAAASTSRGCSRPWPSRAASRMDKPWSKLTKPQRKILLYGAGDAAGASSTTATGTAAALLRHHIRRRRAVAAAPPQRGRLRLGARAGRGLHARGGLPGVRRDAA